jgi:hypothetical protein
MASLVNRQPIFTAIPILVSIGTDIEKNTDDTYNTTKCTVIYTDSSTYGSLITKITVRANANTGIPAVVSAKRVDLYISLDSDTDRYGLYQSIYIRETSITPSVEVPSAVFQFPDGLIVKPGKKLALSATETFTGSDDVGDYVSVIVEGGTYDQPA